VNPFDFKLPQQSLLGGYYSPTPMQRRESPLGGALSTAKKKRQVFFSFHYDDVLRAAQVRNMGVVDNNRLCSPNDWEKVWRGGDAAIQRWITGQMAGRTCTVVLIGAETYLRDWVRYEIIKSWNAGMGVLGLHIHGLNCPRNGLGVKGPSPFFAISVDNKRMSDIVPVLDPFGLTSRQVHASIRMGLNTWIERAIAVRKLYPNAK